MIYLIHNTSNNTLKIGKSNNPEKRLKQLLTGTSDNLVLLKTIEGNNDTIFKKIYSDYHIVREWYNYSENIIKTFYKNETTPRINKNKSFICDIKIFKGRNIISIKAMFYNKQQVKETEDLINKYAVKYFNFNERITFSKIEYGSYYRKTYFLNY